MTLPTRSKVEQRRVRVSLLAVLVHTFRHVIYAPAKTNQYAAAGFPAVADAMSSEDAKQIREQVGIATYFVRGALATLKDFNKFIVA